MVSPCFINLLFRISRSCYGIVVALIVERFPVLGNISGNNHHFHLLFPEKLQRRRPLGRSAKAIVIIVHVYIRYRGKAPLHFSRLQTLFLRNIPHRKSRRQRRVFHLFPGQMKHCNLCRLRRNQCPCRHFYGYLCRNLLQCYRFIAGKRPLFVSKAKGIVPALWSTLSGGQRDRPLSIAGFLPMNTGKLVNQ